MKKLLLFLFTACTLLLGCRRETYYTEAKVLAVNDHVLEGKLIGDFLTSSSGYISNDVIKLSVDFGTNNVITGYSLLLDLPINHAEAIKLGKCTEVKLIIIKDRNYSPPLYKIYLYESGRLLTTLTNNDFLGVY